jgi:dTDP-4-dehydrorhamnose 3,5-epimerase
MQFHPTSLQDAVLISPTRRGDERGWFARTFCRDTFAAQGLEQQFVQQNSSLSRTRGTLRGMHFQGGAAAEVKLLRCVSGAVCDIIIDLRPESPSFKRWEAFELSAENGAMLYVPRGFAHGFQTLTPDVEMTYLVSAPYTPEAEGGVRWNDPAFNLVWPLQPTVLSDKDRAWPDYQPAVI